MMPAPSAKNGKSVVDFPGGSAGRASMPARPGAFDPVSLKFYSTGMPVPTSNPTSLKRVTRLRHRRMPIGPQPFILRSPRLLDLATPPSNMRVAVLPVEFFDAFSLPESSQSAMQETLFGTIPTGSMREYWLSVSGGKLEVKGTVHEWELIRNSTVCEVPRAGCYAQGDSGVRSSEPNMITLVRDAVRAFDEQVDFSMFDSNLDGTVDGLILVHPGVGAEESGEDGDFWSSMWEIDPPLLHDGVKIDSFVIVPELTCRGPEDDPCAVTGPMAIGVAAHEFGHILGLPDLYDTSYWSNGIGVFDLMSAGAYGGDLTTPESPVGLSAWVRIALGFVQPKLISGDADSVKVPGDGGTVVRIPANGPDDTEQYFLVENRQANGFDGSLPCHGLYIWHIDDKLIAQRYLDRNSVQAFWLHRGVDLEEADGQNELDKRPYRENRGDAGDCYPGEAQRTRFSRFTVPSSEPYFDVAYRGGYAPLFDTTYREDYQYEVAIEGLSLDGGKKEGVFNVRGVSSPVGERGSGSGTSDSTPADQGDAGYSAARADEESKTETGGGCNAIIGQPRVKGNGLPVWVGFLILAGLMRHKVIRLILP